MDSICLQCSEPVTTLNQLKCQGFCDRIMHLSCSTLTRPKLDMINDSANILWLCDSCVDLMKSSTVNAAFTALSEAFRLLTDTHKTALEALKAEMEKTRKSVESATTLPATPISWPVPNRAGAKRARKTEDDKSLSKSDVPSLTCGKKKGDVAKVPTITVQPATSKCWIYLSRIATTVSEDEVGAMVKECLSSDDPVEVKKLVKKDANLSGHNFISFKIGVDPKPREMALNAETWPDGMYFREFIDFRQERTNDGRQGFRKTPRLG
ncbi:uncharacterized protein LOC131687477 [Topomyia yanbarensis]|uniref:uncharacterized protein LOC131687477 n=1 Tax=Topomyia yanbarensis TaxID=2498891 RepID=UPI00273BE72B|nr:uncharacterized protein LOC131687477 [Topomyia yanbarensis]